MQFSFHGLETPQGVLVSLQNANPQQVEKSLFCHSSLYIFKGKKKGKTFKIKEFV